MGQLVPYIRSADESIARIASGIYQSSGKQMAPYLFEEKLTGWPVSKVYWAKESGPCLGVAPSTGNLSSPGNITKPDTNKNPPEGGLRNVV